MICVICNCEIENVCGWAGGHNAEPVAEGRCCGDCNAACVIPARLLEVFSRSQVSNQRFSAENRGT
jgi:hypothetical protein